MGTSKNRGIQREMTGERRRTSDNQHLQNATLDSRSVGSFLGKNATVFRKTASVKPGALL